MQLSISTNFAQVQRQLDQLQKDVANKALASALNKTVAQAKTAMSKEIRAEFNMDAATVSQSLRIDRARASGARLSLSASLSSVSKKGGRSLNLARFIGAGALKSFGSRKNRSRSPSFKVKRGGPRMSIPGSFLINNGKTLMIREGKARLPIKALQTIDVPGMFNTRRINAKVIAFIKAKLPTIFDNEARYFTERFNARSGK